jgi:hypothetical protein
MFGNDYSCEMTLAIDVILKDTVAWHGQYTSNAEISVSMIPFVGLGGIEQACGQAVGNSIRRGYAKAMRDIFVEPPIVRMLSDLGASTTSP